MKVRTMFALAGIDTLAIVGCCLIFAFIVGQVFRRIGIPQVVGFIFAGVLLGPSFLHIVPNQMNESLTFVSEITLGLIGFEMGGHLRLNQLKEMGKSILCIVIFEAFGAFALVFLGVFLLTRQLHTSLIFGALASATAPAATVDVLAEYHSQGPLTTTLLAVVGLDDAISLLLFSISAAISEALLADGGSLSLADMLEIPLLEIGGSLLVGIVFGLLLNFVMRRFHLLPREHDAIVIPIGTVFICTGIARLVGLSPILTTMTLGIVVVNLNAVHGKYIRTTIEQAGPVMYVLFFMLAGARFDIALLPAMGWLGVAYIGLRSFGKYTGVRIGGALGRSPEVVRKYLGWALLSQAGVAIGLAIDSSTRFSRLGDAGAELGTLVLNVITATTLVVQLIGPIGVKLAISKADEVGKALEGLFE